jgi:H+/gluconate symporter-like permease
MRLAAAHGIDPALLHRIAVMSAGTLDSLPQNGAVITLLPFFAPNIVRRHHRLPPEFKRPMQRICL